MDKKVLLGAAGLALSFWCWRPVEARACELACSAPPVRLFYTGAPIPGNLIYFKVLIDEPGDLTLKTKDGDVIPASIRTIGRDRVFAPETALTGGLDLVLTYQARRPLCDESLSDPSGVSLGEFAFRSADAREVALGTSRLQASDVGARPEDDSVFVDVSYFGPDQNGAVAHLLDTTVSVDAYPFAGLEQRDGSSVIEVLTSCQRDPVEDTCGYWEAVPAGEHTVKTMTTVVGQDRDPEITTLQVSTSCAADERGADDAGEDAGAVEPIASDDPSEAAPLRPKSAREGGCSAHPAAASGGASTSALLLGLSLLSRLPRVRRRRRARR